MKKTITKNYAQEIEICDICQQEEYTGNELRTCNCCQRNICPNCIDTCMYLELNCNGNFVFCSECCNKNPNLIKSVKRIDIECESKINKLRAKITTLRQGKLAVLHKLFEENIKREIDEVI